MRLLQRGITALILGLAVVAPSAAGEAKESHSARPGLFFAWLSPDDGSVVVQFDDPAHVRALARHCNAGRGVFSTQTGVKYQCKMEVPKNASGQEQWDSAEATVQGEVPQSDTRQFGLFSMAPVRATRWATRRISAPEVEAIAALLRSDTKQFGAVQRQLNLATASVVSQPGSPTLAIIVPGRVVEDRAAFYHARRHHVFTQNGSGVSYLGEVPGKPVSFADIDQATQLPGLVVSEGCDGWCITLWSLAGGLRQVGRFGGH